MATLLTKRRLYLRQYIRYITFLNTSFLTLYIKSKWCFLKLWQNSGQIERCMRWLWLLTTSAYKWICQQQCLCLKPSRFSWNMIVSKSSLKFVFCTFAIFGHYAISRKVAGSIPDEVVGSFNCPNPTSRTMALGSTQPLTEMITRNLPGGKGRLVLGTDNFIAICEPIVWKMWEPLRLTTLWAFTAYYRDSFTFLFFDVNTSIRKGH
jgi:hypothetical protein